jgi:hypothetical protein
MRERLPRIAALFGLTRFTFRLSGRERDWLIYISILPLIVIAAIAIELYIRIDSGNLTQLGDTYRFYVASQVIAALAVPISVAVLFVAGVTPVSRPVASWAALIAFVLILTALVSGAFVTVVVLGATASFDLNRYYSDVWRTLSSACGFLAVGYAFLAYRGLSRPPTRRLRRVRVRRPEDQPREL